MLWVDKHRPASLDAMEFHRPMAERLARMVRPECGGRACPPRFTRVWRQKARSGDVPHLLFYGPPGSGKKTRIIALLREIYGPGASKVRAGRLACHRAARRLTPRSHRPRPATDEAGAARVQGTPFTQPCARGGTVTAALAPRVRRRPIARWRSPPSAATTT